jgi:Zn finger protein HypA/HybF involved in hydrogenase expression
MGNKNCNIYYEEFLKNPSLKTGYVITNHFGQVEDRVIECNSCNRPVGEHKRSTCICQKCHDQVTPLPTKEGEN